MESPAIGRSYIAAKAKKRVFPGGSSMDPDVIEIPPPTPINRSSKSKTLKLKEVVDQEIIDVDMDENSCNVMLTEGIGTNYKGKGAITNNSLGIDGDGGQSSKKNSAPGSHSVVNLEGFACDLSFLDDDYVDMYPDGAHVFDDNQMYEDEYEILQSHFDNIDIPPGVEAPVSWFPGPAQNKINVGATKNPALSNPKPQPSPGVILPEMEASHSLWSLDPWGRMPTTNTLGMETPVQGVSHPHKAGLSSSWSTIENAQSKKNIASSKYFQHKAQSSGGWGFVNKSTPFGLASSYGPHKPPGSLNQQYIEAKAAFRGDNILRKKTKHIARNPYIPNASEASPVTSSWYKHDNSMYVMLPPNYPTHYNPFLSEHMSFDGVAYDPFLQDSFTIQTNATDLGVPLGSSSGSQKDATFLDCPSDSSQQNVTDKHVNRDEILMKLHQFKKFDVVQDPSDHHYVHNGSSSKQPSKSWAKKIQEEWKILEKDLPDTIFVRAYESRMDLLRAVIIGAEGTPYHDGLFFFDVLFPDNYPHVPPHVYYHSRGLRLNPNLYNNGKVCLSLLNTWSGSQKEMWIPNLSTMLQVLVSIQGLILNAKPYFNEPAYDRLSGTPHGEKSSQHYNESTFILSLKTMVFTLKKQPKHFEDFVVGHFFKCALDVLVACKAYMDGAQVGCLVKGGVQDVDEGDKSCSQNFKATLGAYLKPLVDAFTQIGVKDCEQFIPPSQKGNSQTGFRQSGHRHMSPALKTPNYFS
ncbi:hypothetical protein ACET3Z_020452 [Daucus carota]